jgi:hypothetical protein
LLVLLYGPPLAPQPVLTIDMIRKLVAQWRRPAESLIAPYQSVA